VRSTPWPGVSDRRCRRHPAGEGGPLSRTRYRRAAIRRHRRPWQPLRLDVHLRIDGHHLAHWAHGAGTDLRTSSIADIQPLVPARENRVERHEYHVHKPSQSAAMHVWRTVTDCPRGPSPRPEAKAPLLESPQRHGQRLSSPSQRPGAHVTFGTRRAKSGGHTISQEATTTATLVVYAIKYGAIQGIAERIADKLVSSAQFRATGAMDQTTLLAGRADRPGPSSRKATSARRT
jgi:hypothetical protein